jgi:hypothetical protein
LLLLLLPAAALAACGRGDGPAPDEAAAPEKLPSEAELARDAELANEAAAAEAADMNNFGGSAAEMDRRNLQ